MTDQTAATNVQFEGDRRLLQAKQEIAKQQLEDPQHAITSEQATAKMTAVQAQMTAEFNASIKAMDLTIDQQNKTAAATAGGALAADKEKASQEALNAARKSFASDSPEFSAAYKEYYNRALELGGGLEKIAAAQEHINNQKQFELIGAEVQALHMQADAAALYVQHTKDMIDVRDKYKHESPDFQANVLKERDAIAAANQSLQQQSAIMQYLAGQVDQAFSTVGTAITNAFAQGSMAAINWGSITKAVLTQVLQAMIQLAIVNPLKQDLFGSSVASAPTLLQVLGTLGGGGTAAASSGGGISQLKDVASTGSSVLSGGSSLLQAFGYQGLGGQVNALFGGPGTSLFAGTGLSGGGIGSAITGFLNTGTGLGATSASSVAGTESLLGLGAGETTGALGGATIGSLAGGIGGGFAIGSLSGSLIQGSMNKVGPAPMAGAAAGAVSGAIIGSIIPGLGTVIGGLIGGLIGGSAGGFIGPHAPSTYSGTQINLDDQGRLTLGLSSNQGTVSSRDASSDATAALNDFTKATNLAVTSLGNLGQIGVGTGADKFPDLASAFSQLRFSSTDPRLNASISDKSFGSFQELQDAVTRIQQMNAAITDFTTVMANTDAAGRIDEWVNRFDNLTVSAADFTTTLTDIANFVTQVVPPLLAANDNIGSFTTQLKALNDQFNPAIARAHDLGYKEAELTAARDKSIQALEDAVNKQYSDMATSLVNRAADAANKFNNASPDVLKAQALTEFDEAAGKQRNDLSTQLKGIFGDDYATTKAYADEIGLLDTALYYERLNAAAQFNTDLAAQDKAAADAQLQAQQDAASKAAQAIDSLVQYTTGLSTSASSPLSPQDQYALAGQQFNAVSGAAAAGDYNSITQLQGYAQTFLDASRTVYGSGASYVTDFQKVLDVLGAVASTAPDTLTASVMQTETRTQTAELVDKLDALQNAVDGVTAQLRQNQAAPPRIAA
jgi:hypothetical protein